MRPGAVSVQPVTPAVFFDPAVISAHQPEEAK